MAVILLFISSHLHSHLQRSLAALNHRFTICVCFFFFSLFLSLFDFLVSKISFNLNVFAVCARFEFHSSKVVFFVCYRKNMLKRSFFFWSVVLGKCCCFVWRRHNCWHSYCIDLDKYFMIIHFIALISICFSVNRMTCAAVPELSQSIEWRQRDIKWLAL